MKTFNEKDVFDSTNTFLEIAKYIGKEGYFSDKVIIDLEDWSRKKKLLKVTVNNSGLFFICNKNLGYKYFLPADKVKEIEEKKYRPFKYFADFLFTTKSDVGNTICYRNKKELNVEIVSVINGFGVNADNELQFVELGGLRIEPDALFEFLEFKNEDKEWHPFGVLENDFKRAVKVVKNN